MHDERPRRLTTAKLTGGNGNRKEGYVYVYVATQASTGTQARSRGQRWISILALHGGIVYLGGTAVKGPLQHGFTLTVYNLGQRCVVTSSMDSSNMSGSPNTDSQIK